ncbi:MAG: hypothetical protein H0T85_08465 [Geodermatophilaceae bacterium]|nr:hypothetical protein [Geodermatophilaceae bacterium]
MAAYRAAFRPGVLTEPYLIVIAQVVAAGDDELMISTTLHRHVDRLGSYDIVADLLALAAASGGVDGGRGGRDLLSRGGPVGREPGRLRDVVRQHVLAGQLSDVLAQRGPIRADVIDIGCGQGTQAPVLARSGHEVTGLDT